MNMTGYTCLSCGGKQGADFSGYVCPECRGNLDITYDYKRIKKTLNHDLPFPSERPDLFRYLPFLPLTRVESAPPLHIGPTPLYPAQRLGETAGLKDIHLKDESGNPSHSFKDRASAVVLARARETNARVVAGASTGNAGSSMACMAASVGLPCVIFVPENAPPAKIAQLLIYGAQVVAVRGSYDDAFDLCARICREKGWLNRNTGFNPFTREGKKTCSFEICEQLDWNAPDRVIVSTGDGNIISGIWKGMRDLHAAGLIPRLPCIDCAQAEGSSAIARAVGRLRAEGAPTPREDWSDIRIEPVTAHTLADSISVDQPRDGIAAVRAVIESGGMPVTVSDEEILTSISELARLSGVFAEPSAAAAWAALKRMAREKAVDPDERIVCLISGSGLKDVAAARRVAGEPITVDPDTDAALTALGKRGL